MAFVWRTLGGGVVLELAAAPGFPLPRCAEDHSRLVWFAGGSLLALGMRLLAAFVQWRSPQWLTWRLGGAAFVGVELVMHLFLQLRGQPSFYNGRG
jgi:hypothetical protein